MATHQPQLQMDLLDGGQASKQPSFDHGRPLPPLPPSLLVDHDTAPVRFGMVRQEEPVVPWRRGDSAAYSFFPEA